KAYSTDASQLNPTRPAIGVQAYPVPPKCTVRVCRSSCTSCRQRVGKKRPIVLPFGSSLSGAPRLVISGQVFWAPKLENSHHRRLGLALTAPLTQGHPTPSVRTAMRPMRRSRSGTTVVFLADFRRFGPSACPVRTAIVDLSTPIRRVTGRGSSLEVSSGG